MILLSTATTFLAICRKLPWWLPCTRVLESVYFFCSLGATFFCFCTIYLIMSNSFASFMSSSAYFCGLCTSTLHSNSSACLVVAALMSSSVTTFRISSIILSSLRSLINCFISSLSHSLYWHLAALVLNLSINSQANSLLFLYRFWYCSDITNACPECPVEHWCFFSIGPLCHHLCGFLLLAVMVGQGPAMHFSVPSQLLVLPWWPFGSLSSW